MADLTNAIPYMMQYFGGMKHVPIPTAKEMNEQVEQTQELIHPEIRKYRKFMDMYNNAVKGAYMTGDAASANRMLQMGGRSLGYAPEDIPTISISAKGGEFSVDYPYDDDTLLNIKTTKSAQTKSITDFDRSLTDPRTFAQRSMGLYGVKNLMSLYGQKNDEGKLEPRSGLVAPGNINVMNRKPVQILGADGQPTGEVGTVRSITSEFDGKHYVLPTIGPNGELWTENQAIDNFVRTKQHLGVFDNKADADTFSQDLHINEEKRLAMQDAMDRNPDQLKGDLMRQHAIGQGASVTYKARPGRADKTRKSLFYYTGPDGTPQKAYMVSTDPNASAAAAEAIGPDMTLADAQRIAARNGVTIESGPGGGITIENKFETESSKQIGGGLGKLVVEQIQKGFDTNNKLNLLYGLRRTLAEHPDITGWGADELKAVSRAFSRITGQQSEFASAAEYMEAMGNYLMLDQIVALQKGNLNPQEFSHAKSTFFELKKTSAGNAAILDSWISMMENYKYYSQAYREAIKEVGPDNPIAIMDKADELYAKDPRIVAQKDDDLRRLRKMDALSQPTYIQSKGKLGEYQTSSLKNGELWHHFKAPDGNIRSIKGTKRLAGSKLKTEMESNQNGDIKIGDFTKNGVTYDIYLDKKTNKQYTIRR